MEEILMGKLLPNLKVTLGAEDVETELLPERDDEPAKDDLPDSSKPNVEIVRSWMETLQNPKVYKNKSGGFSTGLDLISEENVERLGKRAERFGLEKDEMSVTPNILSLYKSMDIDIENRNSAKMKSVRLDALHMRGVNDLNTHQIFDYFKDFGPASVEWINDFSCNVVWLDETSCARALLGISKPLSGQNKVNNTTEEVTDMSVDNASESEGQISSDEDDTKEESAMVIDGRSEVKPSLPEETPEVSLDIPVPPGHWRLGTPHPKAKTILLRFATKDDKKLPGAEKRSDFYKKYGNPNYGGLRGLISGSRKRKMQAAVNRQAVEEKGSSKARSIRSLSPEASVPKPSHPKPPPRMRMYADDEELKAKKLRITNSFVPEPRREKRKGSVHSRLGAKYTRDELSRLSTQHYDTDDPPRRRRRRSDDDDDLGEEDARPGARNASLWRESMRQTTRDSNRVDLRTKLKRLRSSHRDNRPRPRPFRNFDNDDDVGKHRSPLCAGDDSSSSED